LNNETTKLFDITLFIENQTFKLAIEFSLENPSAGIRFYNEKHFDKKNETNPANAPFIESLERAFLLYTFENNPHCWFPCINSYNEKSTWKIEITLSQQMQMCVVTSGNLIETETIGNNKIKHHFFLQVPTSPCHIGLFIGNVDKTNDENISDIVYYCKPELIHLLSSTGCLMSELFDFFEDTLMTTFPYSSYKIVFLSDLPEDCLSFASLTFLK
jgi:hypothetical protein